MKLYRDIFSRSWKVTHAHKSLWWFGFFALLWGGKGIDFELFLTNARLLTSGFSPFQPGFWQLDQWSQIATVFFSSPTPALLVSMMVAFGVFLVAVIIISQIGLIDAFGKFGKAKAATAAKKYSVEDAIHASEHHFLSVLGANMLGKLFSYGLFVLVALPLFFGHTVATRLFTVFGLFIVIAPLTVIISLITKYAINAIVLKDMSVRASLAYGFTLFRTNIGISIELALFMMIAFFVINMIALFFGVLIALPFGVMVQMVFPHDVAVLLYYGGTYAIALMCIVLSSVIFSTWHFGNWTLLFQELTKGKKQAKLHRILKGE